MIRILLFADQEPVATGDGPTDLQTHGPTNASDLSYANSTASFFLALRPLRMYSSNSSRNFVM